MPRALAHRTRAALARSPVVALLGPRQVGKTTLALDLSDGLEQPTLYLDLERPSDLSKLGEAELYLTRQFGKTVILDEIQRKPELFAVLRSLVDEQIRAGTRSAQYLVLGSASRDLLQQSSETVGSGRVEYLELTPLQLLEVLDAECSDLDQHWVRGGYPRSLLAESTEDSVEWRNQFVRTYLERDLAQLGLRLPAEQLLRFWTMLGHGQGNPLNASRLATSLGKSSTTVRKYLDLLTDLFMVRQLAPWSGNSAKRLVKSPKIYVRDSGLLHSLVNIPDFDTLVSHPICGESWEGYVIENICSRIPDSWQRSYYRTGAQAEIDLVLEAPDRRCFAIEIKRTSSPKPSRGFRLGADDIGATDRLFVIPKGERYPVSDDVDAIGLGELLREFEAG